MPPATLAESLLLLTTTRWRSSTTKARQSRWCQDTLSPPPRRKRPAEHEGKNGKAKAKAVPKVAASARAVKRPCETAEDLHKSREQKRPCGKVLQRAARVETEKAALKRNLEQRGSQLRQTSAEPAALRMERLHKRVRLRLGGESTAVLE